MEITFTEIHVLQPEYNSFCYLLLLEIATELPKTQNVISDGQIELDFTNSPNHHAGICSQRLDITMQEFALEELIISILYNSVLPLKWISLLGTLSSRQGWVEGAKD